MRAGPKNNGLRRAIRYLLRFRRQALLPYLFLIVATLAQLAVPRMVRNVIDAVTEGVIARQVLAGVAGRRQLRWSFRVVRGQVTAELLTAAQEADMLAIGRASGAMTRHVRLGGTAREVLAQVALPVLLLQHGHTLCHPVQLVYDGSTAAKRALAAATRVASAAGGHLTVIIVAGAADHAQRLQGETEADLQAQQIQGHYRQLINPTAEELAQALQRAGGGTLIIGADNPLLRGEGLPTLLEAIDCSVLLIR